MSGINWSMTKSEISTLASEYSEKNHFFSTQIEETRKLINSFFDSNDNLKKTTNKVIGIVGERGTGKSSVLNTLKNVISEEYHTMNIIDPSIFNEELGLIELFLNEVFKEITNNEVSSYNRTVDSKNIARNILIQLKELTNMLANLSSKGSYKLELPAIETLETISHMTSFKQELDKLIDDYIKFVSIEKSKNYSKKAIIIFIDDLDMVDDVKVYSILEDIRKYFSVSVITIISYRNTQLFNAVLQNKLNLNKSLITNPVFDNVNENEIINQSRKYIEKLIPQTQRVFLFDNKDLLNSDLKKLVSPLIEAKNSMEQKEYFQTKFIKPFGYKESVQHVTIREWLYKALKESTNLTIQPVDKKEESEYILPDNIRGLLQLIEIIIEKFEYQENEEFNYLNELNRYRNNIREYKNYLLSSAIDKLKTNDKKLIEEWEFIDYSSKNYFIYSNLLGKIFDYVKDSDLYSSKNFDYILRINEVENINVCIGDVYMIIEEYKKIVDKDISSLYFVYILKMLYSIEIFNNYLEYAINEKRELVIQSEEYLNRYLTILNVKIMPDNFIYYGSISTKSLKLSKNNDEDFEEFLNKIIYSPFATLGYVTQRSRPTFDENWNLTETLPFKYRHFFETENQTFQKEVNYFYDPYSFLGKKYYVTSSLEKENYYIFTSLFDIDIFVRMNYSRRSEANPFGKMLRKVNAIFSKELDLDTEKELCNKLSGFLIKDSKKCIIYEEKEVNYTVNTKNIESNKDNYLEYDIKGTDSKKVGKSVEIKTKGEYLIKANSLVKNIEANFPEYNSKVLKSVKKDILYLSETGNKDKRITLNKNHRNNLSKLERQFKQHSLGKTKKNKGEN